MIRSTVFSLTVALVVSLGPSTVFAQKKPAQDDARMLSLEVVALQTLQRLDLTAPQLEGLLRLSKGAASTPAASGAQKVTPAFLKTLKALRNALAADDEDSIETLKEKLHEIMDKDKIVLDDRVPVSDVARRGAPMVIRGLTPGQTLAYVQILDEEDVDPLDMLEARSTAARTPTRRHGRRFATAPPPRPPGSSPAATRCARARSPSCSPPSSTSSARRRKPKPPSPTWKNRSSN